MPSPKAGFLKAEKRSKTKLEHSGLYIRRQNNAVSKGRLLDIGAVLELAVVEILGGEEADTRVHAVLDAQELNRGAAVGAHDAVLLKVALRLGKEGREGQGKDRKLVHLS